MGKIFTFGKLTENENFINRNTEQKKLSVNFENGVNTILISPRRWGKTSLVHKVAHRVMSKNKKTIVVLIDAFMCKSEEDFYKEFSTEIIKQTSNRWDEWTKVAGKFLSNLSPKFSFGINPETEFSMSLNISEEIENEKDILRLPQKIAEDKKIKIIVCIDEFQQLAEFKQTKFLQQKLRSIWQAQKDVSYCLYGSKMHLLYGFFTKQSMPFYKFGEIFYLPKIETSHWAKYIDRQFKKSGKTIAKDFIIQICIIVENHPSYVQQLSWIIWTKTKTAVNSEIYNEAIDDLLTQNSILYNSLAGNLTAYQLNFLKAVLNGIDNSFYSSKIINGYKLSSSANVTRIMKSLENKEIIDITNKKVTFLDPVFKMWLKKELK